MNEPTNPGSLAAIRAGCKCPATVNQHGRGLPGTVMSPQHETRDHCPLHGLGRVWSYEAPEREVLVLLCADEVFEAKRAGRPKRAA